MTFAQFPDVALGEGLLCHPENKWSAARKQNLGRAAKSGQQSFNRTNSP